ncbi:lanthionine synthetase C family protein [Kitasatospora sp. NPDC056181]|uniref:lanthionine synthetase C family protein n=1 Tax=Kitasatospora sp. NPDC056181 TaxID=3345737 RepID=UPI0035DBF0F8
MTTTVSRDRDALAALAKPLLLPPDSNSAKWGQSLAKGAPGIALLHVVRAATGSGDWNTAHAWVAACLRRPVLSTPGTGLYFGAPVLAHLLRTAAAYGPRPYASQIAQLDNTVEKMAERRLAAAHQRITQLDRPIFAEYDLLYGMTGLGVHLRTCGDSHLLRDVLTYLVRLTEPLRDRPGWWTDIAPSGDASPHYPGGHGNLGLAHGIPGPLALLALTYRDGIRVPGHRQAITRITAWLDAWRQDAAAGSWWPEAVTANEVHVNRTRQQSPLRPSWCYGTPGIAHALHLAALATEDEARARSAEQALSDCLADSAQLAELADNSLCHGTTGLRLLTHRFADRVPIPDTADRLRAAADGVPLLDIEPAEPGLLEGAAGTALALQTLTTVRDGINWDACLLLI